MSRKVSLWVLCTLIVTLTGGCSNSPTEPEGSLEVRAAVSQATVRPFDQLNWEVTVTNTTSRAARLDLASGCTYNFQVFRGSQVVWDLSTVSICTQGVTSIELQPGESRRGTGTWNVHDLSGNAPSPGEYEARGSVLTQPQLTSQPVRITVQG